MDTLSTDSVNEQTPANVRPEATGFLNKRLSPLAQRRWLNFKKNRRGWWSLWIFLVLFVLSLGVEFIANDKPIVVSYDNQLYWPVFKSYPETAFGGDFDTEAEYRDEFVQELINEKGWMLWPVIRYSYDTINLASSIPCLLYTSPSPRDKRQSRMPSSA